MNTKIFLVSILLTVTTLLSAQDKISLTEVEKVREYLSLNDSQYNSIKKYVTEIESILDEDKRIIEDLKKRVMNDDEPGFFEKIKAKRGRDDRVSKIKDLKKKIERQLNDEQKEKYKNIIKPDLQGLSKEEIFGPEK
ncbi:MAG: hypothetical protein HND40_11485 [Ignavibacteriota bacterium]|nr:hypothetical protein [Ignavibacteriota bacterium]MBW7869366.1 hypothetical protein [Brumimicrobium sp.]MCO6446484.1 hypothetical protein [Ignavibacterium album]MCZ2267927.1 hypothetical protein [Ignavibacteriales bacterium]MEB2297555.1 hypothetical protein [Ignavibacteria bacterium]HOJ06413.1 hypothetical protein [Ignavibacteriaceae bacterium]